MRPDGRSSCAADGVRARCGRWPPSRPRSRGCCRRCPPRPPPPKATEQAAPDTAAKHNATVSDDTTPIPRSGPAGRVASCVDGGGLGRPGCPGAEAARPPRPRRGRRRCDRAGDPAGAATRASRPRPIATPAAARRRQPAAKASPAEAAAGRQPRRARLRLTRIDPWSVMKTAFLLSIALGVVTIVVGDDGVVRARRRRRCGTRSTPRCTTSSAARTPPGFDITGLRRHLPGARLHHAGGGGRRRSCSPRSPPWRAFLYNMAAALLGGIEVTLAEDQADRPRAPDLVLSRSSAVR